MELIIKKYLEEVPDTHRKAVLFEELEPVLKEIDWTQDTCVRLVSEKAESRWMELRGSKSLGWEAKCHVGGKYYIAPVDCDDPVKTVGMFRDVLFEPKVWKSRYEWQRFLSKDGEDGMVVGFPNPIRLITRLLGIDMAKRW